MANVKPRDYDIIAVDPGKATGMVLLQMTNEMEVWECDPGSFYSYMLQPDGWMKTVMVYEEFVISQRTVRMTAAPWSLEHIGVMKAVAWTAGGDVRLVKQQAAAAKKLCSNDTLRSLGWWHSSDHCRDALRHMYLYLVNERLLAPVGL